MSRLDPVPLSPNCVSSYAEPTDRQHWVAPLGRTETPEESINQLEKLLRTMPNVSISERGQRYLHAVFTSPLLKFKDDLQLEVADDGVIHVRSASRVGWHDLGVNRRRVETLRQALNHQ